MHKFLQAQLDCIYYISKPLVIAAELIVFAIEGAQVDCRQGDVRAGNGGAAAGGGRAAAGGGESSLQAEPAVWVRSPCWVHWRECAEYSLERVLPTRAPGTCKPRAVQVCTHLHALGQFSSDNPGAIAWGWISSPPHAGAVPQPLFCDLPLQLCTF